MAENFSYTPDDETDKPADVEETPKQPRRQLEWLRGMPESFLVGQDPEKDKKDDEEEDDDTEKPKSPSLFRRFFPKLVDREDVKDDRDRGSILFGRGDADDGGEEHGETPEAPAVDVPTPIAAAETRADAAAEAGADTPDEPSAPEAPDAAPEAADVPPMPTPEAPTVVVAAEAPPNPPAPEAPQPPAIDTDPIDVDPLDAEAQAQAARNAEAAAGTNPETTTVVSRGVGPEAVLLSGLAYEHHRVTKLKRRERKLERQVKKMDRTAQKVEKRQEIFNRRAESKLQDQELKLRETERIVRQPEKPKEKEKLKSQEVKHEHRAAEVLARPEKTAEQRPELKKVPLPEVVVEQKRNSEEVTAAKSEGYSESQKQAIIETVLKVPENILEAAEEHKEIAYELSHEHKDLDKQSAAAWAALQAAADDQAKANAQAIAAAAKVATSTTSKTPLVPPLPAKVTPRSQYKKAALSGFITAVVIFAVIMVVILLNSK